MNFKVGLSTSNNFIIKLSSTPILKTKVGQTLLANVFTELSDVNITNLTPTNDKYVVTYDATSGKFVIVDPDVVLSAASTTTGPQPGLPGDFVDTLDVDLDDRIDLDAGSW